MTAEFRRKTAVNNETGMVLLLAVFMMLLLSLIGLSALRTSTTEIEIAANEKFREIAFYNSESGMSIAAELIDKLEGRYEADPEYGYEQTVITVTDVAFLAEQADTTAGGGPADFERQGSHQKGDAGALFAVPGASDTRYDVEVSGSINAVIDIDKLGSRALPGAGTEFAAGAPGRGASSAGILYEIDSIGTCANSGKLQARNLMGYELIPKN